MQKEIIYPQDMTTQIMFMGSASLPRQALKASVMNCLLVVEMQHLRDRFAFIHINSKTLVKEKQSPVGKVHRSTGASPSNRL